MTLSQQRIKQLDDNDGSKEASKEVFVIQSREHFNSRGRHQGSHARKSHWSTSSGKNNRSRELSLSSQSSKVNKEGSKKMYGNNNSNFSRTCSC